MCASESMHAPSSTDGKVLVIHNIVERMINSNSREPYADSVRLSFDGRNIATVMLFRRAQGNLSNDTSDVR